jgi:hypothetical protein
MVSVSRRMTTTHCCGVLFTYTVVHHRAKPFSVLWWRVHWQECRLRVGVSPLCCCELRLLWCVVCGVVTVVERKCVCVCVRTNVCTYNNECVNVSMCVLYAVYTHVSLCVRTYLSIYIYVCVCTRVSVYVRTHVCICVNARICVCVRVCVRAYLCMYVRTYLCV